MVLSHTNQKLLPMFANRAARAIAILPVNGNCLVLSETEHRCKNLAEALRTSRNISIDI